MLQPKAIADAIRRLRGTTLQTFDRLSDEQMEIEAVPGWSIADVFRHLADSDRGAVLAIHLREFLPGRSLEDLERANDRNLERLRGVDRPTLRRELERWGTRLARVVALTPAPAARVTVPTAFGRLPLGWVACLRPYDEWVHQWDIATALGHSEPAMDLPLTSLLAEFQLRALPVGQRRDQLTGQGVVQVVLDGVEPLWSVPMWSFDLGRRQFGAHVPSRATVTLRLDVPAFCLVAADRVSWRDLESAGRIRISGDDRKAAETLLDAVRVV